MMNQLTDVKNVRILNEVNFGQVYLIKYLKKVKMKKKYPTSDKAKEWKKHLKPYGKRLANKSTRKINKKSGKNIPDL
ncbi:MAG: hypothetical protein IPJ01_10955 [Micavibrio sp.]|nr:hypothetical protein [Micavibrio sp.]